MGARQVSRLAAVAAALGIALGTGPAAAAPTPGEPVIVVDLRPGDEAARAPSRAAFRARLDGITGLRVLRSDGDDDSALLDAALAGSTGDADLPRARAALAEAREAFGALDCARARPAAELAVGLIAARQAAGLDDSAALRTAWAYALLCADRDGDMRAAQVAAARLRGLGVTRGEDVGISAATWDRFPEIDAATDRDIVELAVSGPAGASIWIDHVAAGAAPLTVFVPAGRHIVAAAAATDARRALRGAIVVDVGGVTSPLEVPMQDATNRWSSVGDRVAGWRRDRRPPTGQALAALMADLRVRFAFVLTGDDVARLWERDGTRAARAIAEGTTGDALAMAAALDERVAALDGRPATDEILRDDRRGRNDHPRWWIYASIVGAVLAGGAVIYAQDSAQDRQRVEIDWP
jgi:hypothetical protein